jgi:hypothetical protein
MRHPPEVHGVEFFTVHDLHGRPKRLAIGIVDNGAVAVALLEPGQPLIVDDGVTVLALAPVEVPGLQKRLGMAMVEAAKRLRD